VINTSEPFCPIYALSLHEHLGFVIVAYVFEMNKKGGLKLKHQRLVPDNMEEFESALDETDKRLITLLYEMTPAAIVKKNTRGGVLRPNEFFRSQFKGVYKERIIEMLQKRIHEALKIIRDFEKPLYFEGQNKTSPASVLLEVHKEKANVLFHFFKNDKDITYYPSIFFREERLDFPSVKKGNSETEEIKLICTDPPWILIGTNIISFEGDIDGKKLDAFNRRNFIAYPLSLEQEFQTKFFEPFLSGSYSIDANGFDITVIEEKPKFSVMIKEDPGKIFSIVPEIHYGDFTFKASPNRTRHFVKKEMLNGRNYKYYRIIRDLESEENFSRILEALPNMNMFQYKFVFEREQAYEWLFDQAGMLREKGIEIRQNAEGEQLHFEKPELSLDTKENGDWFDIQAIVKIGKYEIPFIKFKRHILQNIREYILPDGTHVLLPTEWFSDYRHLLEVADKDDDQLRIKRFQAGLLFQLPSYTRKQHLQRLVDFETIDSMPKPKGLSADLRPYQQSGFDWLCFLEKYKYGGILSDDMGLGKTLQTLCFIQYLVEKGSQYPVLVIMPTSLIYNWHQEAAKFTPNLKILVYRGLQREKEIENFNQYDLILTSYGVARNDEAQLSQCPFEYMILDESQIIKNYSSKTAQALRNYSVTRRLTLTGTPIENTTMDLWSQMNFLNPGLLGGETFFRNYYSNPIDKEGNPARAEKLRSLIKPFIIRRTKDQVATELPPKVEQVHYCEMTEEQTSCYEAEKSRYRNAFLDDLKTKGAAKSKFNLLAGLQKLRQIALHPEMVGYKKTPSGKFEELIRMTTEIVEKGSKVLIFSQFVKMLNILKKELKEKEIPFAYIDGSVKDRMEEVEKFQKDSDCQVFLISLKAGGTGLNLTAAEYVFILDPWWNPAAERQAADRAHRIGQDKTVFIYKFISKDTIEEKILKLQERKSRIAADLIQVEEDFFKSLNEDDIKALLD
jgi:SNF2 family DNA or RNA helicase